MRTFHLSLALLLLSTPAFAGSPPPAKAVLKGTKTQRGFLTVHRKGHEAYLEISRLKQPFLLATTVSGGPTYAGMQWQTQVCYWDRVGDQVLLMEKEVRYKVRNRTKPMASAVKRTYTDRLLVACPIVALQGRTPLIRVDQLFGGQAKTFFGQLAAGLDARVVLIDSLKVYPQNLELTVTVPDKRRGGRLTSLSYSLSSLTPRTAGYRPRLADDRVGYFLTAVKDFTDSTTEGDRFVRFLNRWKLQKADRSLKRSPVKKPIIFYLERTVPYRYRQAVTEGILEWNKAFERVGLLGALVVRQQTKQEFADLEPEDVRWNFFRWIVSERSFAAGPSRVNPWTGQILDADIIFDESMVRAYLRQYDRAIRRAPRKFFSPQIRRMLDADPKRYAFAAGSAAGDAELEGLPAWLGGQRCSLGPGVAHQLSLGALAMTKKQAFPEEFINQVVKDVVMHEVGHTLGLRHNFKASTWRPLSEINAASRPGDLCASVMDYNPINVPSDPKANHDNYTMRTLGPYDYWAIRFGYDPNEGAARKATLAAVTSAQFAYGTDEDTWGPDPDCTRWDLGRDPLAYAEDRMKLDQGLFGKVVDRVVKKGQSYRDARRAVDMLLYDYQAAALTATRFVGGQHTHRDHRGDKGERPAIVPVAAKEQRRALELVCRRVFDEGSLTLAPKLLDRLGKGHWSHWGSRDPEAPHSYPYFDRVLNLQAWVLYGVTNPATLERLVDTAAKVGENEDVLTVPEVLDRLTKSIFGKLLQPTFKGRGTARRPLVSTIQRNLQRHYVGQLIDMTIEGEGGPTPPVVRALARRELRRVHDALSKLGERAKSDPGLTLDPYTQGHLEAVVGRAARALAAGFSLGEK